MTSSKKSMKNYILFDMDGTLFDTSAGITGCVREVLANEGIEENDRNALLRFIGPPLTESFTKFYGITGERLQKIVRRFRALYEEKGVYDCEPIPGAEECLQSLIEAKKTLCVATCKPERFAEIILKKFDFSRYFTVVCGSEEDMRRTRKEEVIAEVFTRLARGGIGAQSVMVGDREHDVLGAKLFGIQSVGIRVGFAEAGELEKAGADFIVNDFAELKDLLLRI